MVVVKGALWTVIVLAFLGVVLLAFAVARNLPALAPYLAP